MISDMALEILSLLDAVNLDWERKKGKTTSRHIQTFDSEIACDVCDIQSGSGLARERENGGMKEIQLTALSRL